MKFHFLENVFVYTFLKNVVGYITSDLSYMSTDIKQNKSWKSIPDIFMKHVGCLLKLVLKECTFAEQNEITIFEDIQARRII